ncbi:MAG: GNAT family N-acetyltransferase [Pseudomonadota bacterium]
MTLEQDSSTSLSETRILHDADADAVRALFKEIFHHDMSAEFWRWKYRARDGCAVGVFKNGELVAHYGGVGAAILLKGKSERALQVVDVMVKVTERKAVRTQSPFFLASSMFLENFIGYDKPYLLGYGFPSNRAMGIAERLGIYAPVGRMFEISWKLDASVARIGFWHKCVQITLANFANYQKKIDDLWQQFSQTMRDYIVVQKDAAFIEHRYLRNPKNAYTILLMTSRITGKPLGLVVLKVEPERALLMDFIGSFQNYPAVLQLAKWQTTELGRQQLATWCSEVFVERLVDESATSTTLPITTPANIWTSGPPPEELQNRWWLTPGDTDFL